jgi:Protein of unknown function (DUF3147)
MQVSLALSALKRTRWYEYALRFLFGGAVTAITGVIAHHYGPVLGGLFLAFPAIFPATATLVEEHEAQRKRRAGYPDGRRGRKAAALDARGAAIGALGLVAFAVVVWQLMTAWNAALCLAAALAAWLVTSVLLWWLSRFRHRWGRRRPAPRGEASAKL